MIASIRGIVQAIGNSWMIIDVGGIGFKVYVPSVTLAKFSKTGKEVRLYTHLHVREDNLSLFGFESNKDLTLFETFLTVKNIGPRLALTMFSTLDSERLIMAIASGDSNTLTSIPGIGKKTSERIVLELKDKLGEEWMVTSDLESVQSNGEVVEALTSLGYSVSEASRAVSALPSDSDLSLEEKITQVLKHFGEKK